MIGRFDMVLDETSAADIEWRNASLLTTLADPYMDGVG